MLTPSGLATSLKDPEMFYHAYVVSQKLKDVDLLNFLQSQRTKIKESPGGSSPGLDLLEKAFDYLVSQCHLTY
jgi:hypothetical protein